MRRVIGGDKSNRCHRIPLSKLAARPGKRQRLNGTWRAWIAKRRHRHRRRLVSCHAASQLPIEIALEVVTVLGKRPKPQTQYRRWSEHARPLWMFPQNPQPGQMWSYFRGIINFDTSYW